ncbi:MAG: bifunctional oligoribonuclease/PAP phosphatase NrnA [Lachnospiraceae bacterium]|nr:bifunctional oligoribonuclease/PAP phosphatase NrnA [Lachnospiraceae bacterium]
MNLLEEIKEAKRIGIAGHVRPDGDCVGSCLALYKYLQNARPDASIKVYLEPVTAVFSFLYGYEDLDSTFAADEPFDVFIALDAGDSERLGDARELFLAAGKRLCFDHHLSNTGYADKNEIKPEASSTCEVLFTHFEKEYIDQDVAKALYTGIVHDTGVFQYSCMSRETFGIVGELIGYGFDAAKIISESFYEKTYVQNQILGRALLESILFMDGRCIASCIDRRMMDFYGVTSEDFDGIVNQLLVTKGCEVAIFMYQTGTLEFKVSMRSKGNVNVAEVASYFKGGGHARAAGCTMMGTYRDVINNLSKHIEKQLS